MNTIKYNSKSELIIKSSKFITLLYKVNDEQTIKSILQNVRITYPSATHYCYAYIIKDKKKSNDDGEPSGTAGIPMLKVLDNYNLTNVLVIVIRYFGGILLGANGLIRAYTKSCTTALDNNQITTLKEGYNITINFPYHKEKEINYLLKDIPIVKKEFNTQITYALNIKKENLEILNNNSIPFTINKETLIED